MEGFTAAATTATDDVEAPPDKMPRVVLNPFQNNPSNTCYDVVRNVIVGLTLFPVRCVILLLVLLLCWLFALFATIGLPQRQSKPFSPMRRALTLPIRGLARVALWCVGVWYIESRSESRKEKDSNNNRFILVANHVTMVDAFYAVYQYGPSAVGKFEIVKVPVIGRVARALQTIFVDRQSKTSRQDVLDAIQNRSRDDRFPPVLIFPEGTTTNGKCLIEFKKGAFTSGATIQPILFQFPGRYSPAACGRNSAGMSVLRMMLQVYNRMQVTKLRRYVPTEEEIADPITFATNVRNIMGARLNVPLTEHSYEDLWLCDQAWKANVDQTFEMKEMERLYGLDVAGLKQLLRRFRELDVDSSGKIDIQQFCRTLNLSMPPSAYAKSIFRFLATLSPVPDGADQIDFREFVHGLSLLSSRCTSEDQVKLAFHLYDRKGEGLVSCEDLKYRLEVSRDLGLPVACGELDTLFSKFDDDGDGMLSIDEFSSLCEVDQQLLQVPVTLAKSLLGMSLDGLRRESARLSSTYHNNNVPRLPPARSGEDTQ